MNHRTDTAGRTDRAVTPARSADATPRPWAFEGTIKSVSVGKDETLHWVGNIHPSKTENYRGPICDIQSCDHLQFGITREEAAANAALIVTAVHSHDVLVALLEDCANLLTSHYSDVVDGDYGVPRPNAAMRMSTEIADTLASLKSSAAIPDRDSAKSDTEAR